MENVPSSAMFLAAVMIMTALFASMAIVLFHQGKSAEDNAAQNIEQYKNNMDNDTLAKYSGQRVEGTSIPDILKELYDKGVEVRVQTKYNDVDSYTSFAGLSGSDDLSSEIEKFRQLNLSDVMFEGYIGNKSSYLNGNAYIDKSGNIIRIDFRIVKKDEGKISQ